MNCCLRGYLGRYMKKKGNEAHLELDIDQACQRPVWVLQVLAESNLAVLVESRRIRRQG